MGYYLCKVNFSSGEVSKSGKAKVTKSQILVEAGARIVTGKQEEK